MVVRAALACLLLACAHPAARAASDVASCTLLFGGAGSRGGTLPAEPRFVVASTSEEREPQVVMSEPRLRKP